MSPETSPVLLIIDVQQGLVEGSPGFGPRSTPSLITNIANILKFWREKRWPILHVQHDDIYDETNDISAKFPETFKIHDCAAPKVDEPVFVKNVGSAFIGTDLPSTLEKLGKRPVVLIGMDGRECVSNTARNGADLGYDITVVWDASASYGMVGLKGEKVDAETTHRMAMAMLLSYAKVESTEDVLKRLQVGVVS